MDINKRVREATRFLSEIRQDNTPGFTAVATVEADGEWTEKFFDDENWDELGDFLKDAITNREDLYFSPRTFTGPKRSNATATPTRLLYSDLDHADPVNPTPYWRWETSPGSWQCIWLATRYLTNEEHPPLNKDLTYRNNADKGGWAASKLLRVPYSYSAKRKGWVSADLSSYNQLEPYPVPPMVKVEGSDHPRPMTSEEWRLYLDKNFDELPGHILSDLLTPTTDRSLKIWMVARRCKEAGLRKETAFHLISGAGWNKWQGVPNKLWADVSKAYAP